MLNFDTLKIPEKGMPTIDIIFAIILLIATLSTAFCVYQATRWNGEQSGNYVEASTYRAESIRATTEGNLEVNLDTQRFLRWVDAVDTGNLKEATFLRQRFSEEFKPAFEAWIAKADATNPVPPGSPFKLPEYKIAKYHEAAVLEEKATAAFNKGNDANENGDLYIANTVLFAIVLFFCGVYSRWDSIKIRTGILLVTLLVFLFALYSMGALLLNVGYL